MKDWHAFQADMAAMPWEALAQCSDVNDQMDSFYLYYNTVLDKHSPVIVKTCRKKYRCPLSKECRRMIRERNSAKQELHRNSPNERHIALTKFKKLRNRVVSLIRRDEKEYFDSLIKEDGTENPWKIVNKMFKKSKKSDLTLSDNGGLVGGMEQVALMESVQKF